MRGGGEGVLARIAQVFADDVTQLPHGPPLTAEERARISVDRARARLSLGHRSPERIAAWLRADVVDEHVAAHAETQGYQPGDSWVPTGYDAPMSARWFAGRDTTCWVRPPSWRARINRTIARVRWRRERMPRAASASKAEDDLRQISDLLGTSDVPGVDSPNVLLRLALFGSHGRSRGARDGRGSRGRSRRTSGGSASSR